jgi:hypothetical protein
MVQAADLLLLFVLVTQSECFQALHLLNQFPLMLIVVIPLKG